MGIGTEITPALLQELFLLGRDSAVGKVSLVFDNQVRELCFRTRYPRELKQFIAACLARRGELKEGAGSRTLFLRDRATWQRVCETEVSPRILVADAELDFEAHRAELLKQARLHNHSAIYAVTSPRPDLRDVVDLPQAQKHEVEEVLKKYKPAAYAERLAQMSNGEVYLLAQLLAGTSERREWARDNVGYQLRHLALLGGWDDSSSNDKNAITTLTGDPYDSWVRQLYPFTRQAEPPVLLDGAVFRPVSRYETWQQLGGFLTDRDLDRFKAAALETLKENDPRLELPKDRRLYATMAQAEPATTSSLFKRGLAESLALLAGQESALRTSPGVANYVVRTTVGDLLTTADWKRWASLSDVMPLLAEAAPDVFVTAVADELKNGADNELRRVFEANEDPLFGRTYHHGLLWALEVLAWSPDYLSRVALCLAQLASLPLAHNIANTPLNTLRSIFLTWLPQTLASVEQRNAAVAKVVNDYPDVGWKLLMAVLPEGHQSGSYNPKPVWRDWFDQEWTGEVTRHEMMRQVTNYAGLAVKYAVGDLKKLDELIARWDHLPREAVDQILDHLRDRTFLQLPDAERFIVWERLVDEIEKHRKFAKADWAMPEEELERLQVVADALRPLNPVIRHQRLFDHHDHMFVKAASYEEDRKKIAALRQEAVRETLAIAGLPELLSMASRVKIPVELGSALGAVGDTEADSFLLPHHLSSADASVISFMRGYVWARYFAAGTGWLDSIDVTQWSVQQKAAFFSFMPFHAAVWRRAEQVLGAETSEYWKRIYPNAFQAADDLPEAVAKAVEFNRGDIAVSGINCLRFNKQEVPIQLALAAVKTVLATYDGASHIDQHELVEAIQLLQESDVVPLEDMTAIEFQSLNLLDRYSGASPVVLERRLATDPAFFHNMVTRAFRSEHKPRDEQTAPSEQDEIAGHVFRLLYQWQTPPGTIDSERLDEEVLERWLADVERLCKESGHWKIAQQLIGTSFVYAPLGIEGLLRYRKAATILDRPESDDMRRGFTTGVFNLRGVHGYTAGREELKLAATYNEFAGKFDLAGFVQIAAALRSLADSYKRDAEREARNNPYGTK